MSDLGVTGWQTLLSHPQRRDHVIQLYTDEAFLVRALGCFVGEGLAQGDAALTVATPRHLARLVERLAADGFEIAPLLARSQLTVFDAEVVLDDIAPGGAIDRAAFLAVVGAALDRVRSAGYDRIRVFGELVNLLYAQGHARAALELEELWNEVLAERGVSLMCAYRLDPFDRAMHRDFLPHVCARHTHLIPVEDYARLDRAVDRAYLDVFGSLGDAAIIRDKLVARSALTSDMPRGAAALLAIGHIDEHAALTLMSRARHHYDA